ncbi:MAG: hypothetical protein HXS43_02305 [Theionarchaea archaeon]|nr:hypothetical protein [Theionarchaea archaeon]
MRHGAGVLIVGLLVATGCLAQGVQGVYYVLMETDPYDGNGDGLQDGIVVYLLFRNRQLEPVVFYEGKGTAHIWVYQEGNLVGEEVASFDSSEIVGKSQGGIVVKTAAKGLGTVTARVNIEGRGEFTAEKRDVVLG